MAIPNPQLNQTPDRLKMLRKKLDQPTTVSGSNFAGATPGGPGPNATAANPMSGTTTPRGPSGRAGPTGAGVAGAALEAGQKPAPSTAQVPVAATQGATQTNGAAPPPATAQDPANPPAAQTIEQMTEDFIRRMLEGKANTAEDEALIRELGLDAQGSALVNQRASMGRAGFGSSGALAAMEGDIRRKQGQADQNAILDLRRSESQRAIDNALAGIGTDAELRKQAQDDAFMSQIIALLGGPQPGESNPGGNDTVDEGEPGSGGTGIQGLGNLPGNVLGGMMAQSPDAALESITARDIPDAVDSEGDQTSSRETAKEVDVQPQGTAMAGSDGKYNYYTNDSGEWFKVAHVTMSGDY